MGIVAALRVFKGATSIGHTLKKARGWLADVALLVLVELQVVENVVMQSLGLVGKHMSLLLFHH
jgi:hypothetical protein